MGLYSNKINTKWLKNKATKVWAGTIPHQKFCLNPKIESVQEIQFHKCPKYIVLEVSDNFMFITCNAIQ